MYVMLFLITLTSSILQINNLTITQLYQNKYLDHSPFYSFTKMISTSNIQLSKNMFQYFSSPVFIYSSSFQNIKLIHSSFRHFIHSPLFIDEESYNGQTFTSYIDANTNTSFKNCIFQIDFTDDYFIFLSSNQFEFDSCQFINSTIDKTSLIYMEKCEATFKYSLFLNIQGSGQSNIILMERNEKNSVKFEYTNFSNNSVDGYLIYAGGSLINFNHCVFSSNNCSTSLVYLIFTTSVSEYNIINDLIIIGNQFNSKTVACEFYIFFENNNNPFNIDQIVINDEILSYSPNYCHFRFANSQISSLVHFNNCCFPNSRENWSNLVNEAGEDNSTTDEDCLDIHLKGIHYGIIGNETIVLQIPKRLMSYFPDLDQG